MGLIRDQNTADKPGQLFSSVFLFMPALCFLSCHSLAFCVSFSVQWRMALGPQTRFLSLMFNKPLPEAELSSSDSKLSGSVWPMCPHMQLTVACKGEVTVYNHDYFLYYNMEGAQRRGNPCRMMGKTQWLSMVSYITSVVIYKQMAGKLILQKAFPLKCLPTNPPT